MPERIHYTHCPVCGTEDFFPVFSARDHTVSGESFPIAECRNCSLRFTQDLPAADFIAPYYKSEEYISHTNTSRGLINRLYQLVRRQTMAGKRKLVEKATGLTKGKLLDLGSGTGSFVRYMREAGWEVKGLEPDAGARATAKQVHGLELEDTSRFFQLAPAQYDAITLWHVLEHVHELHAYMRQLKTLMKGNGKLFIAVPNYRSFDAGLYQEHWAAYDVPRHLYHFSPKSMELLAEKNDLAIITYRPMWYDSFYISLLSSKYKNGRSNLPAAFWNGLRSNLVALGNVKKCSSVVYILSAKKQV